MKISSLIQWEMLFGEHISQDVIDRSEILVPKADNILEA